MSNKIKSSDRACAVCGKTFKIKPRQEVLRLCANCYADEKEHRDGHYLDTVVKGTDALEEIAEELGRIRGIMESARDNGELR